MYDYNSEICYESKDDIIINEMLIVKKRVNKLIEYKQKLIEKCQKAANTLLQSKAYCAELQNREFDNVVYQKH
jgi:hypothetical protein